MWTPSIIEAEAAAKAEAEAKEKLEAEAKAKAEELAKQISGIDLFKGVVMFLNLEGPKYLKPFGALFVFKSGRA